MTFSELGAIARLARRTARREWKRTLLIVLLIAVPVAGAIVTAGVMRASTITEQESLIEEFGGADLKIETLAATDELRVWVQQQLDAVDSAAEVEIIRSTHVGLAGQGGWISDIDPTSPLAAGRVQIAAGERPQARGEVAVSPAVLDYYEVAIGDALNLDFGHEVEFTFTVTGVVERPLRYRSAQAVVTPDQFGQIVARSFAPEGYWNEIETWLIASDQPDSIETSISEAWETTRSTFVAAPAVTAPELGVLPNEFLLALNEAQVQQLVEASSYLDDAELITLAAGMVDHSALGNMTDVRITSRERQLGYVGTRSHYGSRLEQPEVMATIIAGLLLAEVALIAGSAYATGTRRRIRELGLLGANGASTGHLRGLVVAEGLVAGLVGSALGVGLAVIALTAGRPIMQRYVDKLITGFPASGWDILGPAIAGIAAAVVAAWWPARTASRVPTVTALQGRIPLRPPHRWLPVVGLSIGAAGIALLSTSEGLLGDRARAVGAAGVAMMIGGAALLTGPIVAWLGSGADRFRATLRLVLRDSARQRTRAATAISAIMAVLLAMVLIGITLGNSEARAEVRGLPAPDNHVLVLPQGSATGPGSTVEPADIADVQRALPGSAAVRIDAVAAIAVFDNGFSAVPDAGDGTVAIADPALLSILGDQRIGDVLDSGRAVVLGTRDTGTQVTIDREVIEAHELPIPVSHWYMPRVLISAETAVAQALTPNRSIGLVVTPEAITSAQFRAITRDLSANVYLEEPGKVTVAQGVLIAGGILLLVVLVIIAAVTSLAATESDRDIRLMVAVGAPPSLRRRFLGLQTGIYVLVAAVLAAPLGWLLFKTASSATGSNTRGPFGSIPPDFVAMPWLTYLLILVVMPVTVGVVTSLVVRSAPPAPLRAGE